MLRSLFNWVGAFFKLLGIWFVLYLVSLKYDAPFLFVLFCFLVLREMWKSFFSRY